MIHKSGSIFQWKKYHLLFCLRRMANLSFNPTHKKDHNTVNLSFSSVSTKFSPGKSVCDPKFSHKSPFIRIPATTWFGAFLRTSRTFKQVHRQTIKQRPSLFQVWTTSTFCPNVFKVPETMFPTVQWENCIVQLSLLSYLQYVDVICKAASEPG